MSSNSLFLFWVHLVVGLDSKYIGRKKVGHSRLHSSHLQPLLKPNEKMTFGLFSRPLHVFHIGSKHDRHTVLEEGKQIAARCAGDTAKPALCSPRLSSS